MMIRFAALLLVSTIGLGQDTLLFEDPFDDASPLSNGGTGGDWVFADQAPPGRPHTEEGGRVILHDGGGGWNVGGLKSIKTFRSGSTVTARLVNVTLFNDSTESAVRGGNGLAVRGLGGLLLAVDNPNSPHPNPFQNATHDAGPSVLIEIGVGAEGAGFQLGVTDGGSELTVWSGLLEGWNGDSPLDLSLTLGVNGEVVASLSGSGVTVVDVVGFSSEGRFEGNIDTDGEPDVVPDELLVAIHSQGVGNNECAFAYDFVRVTGSAEPRAPVITSQPSSLTVVAGGELTLTVGVSGDEPFQFEWSRNGTLLTDPSESTLTVTNAQASDSGTYVVKVTNAAGETTSDDIVVSVLSLQTEFVDEFADGNPETNPGAGGGWVQLNQAEPIFGHYEADSKLTLSSADGGYNIGGLGTANPFAPGTTFQVTLLSQYLSFDAGRTTTWGTITEATDQADITIADFGNTAPYPNTYNNRERAALGVQVVHRAWDNVYGFTITVPALDGNPASPGSRTVQSGDLDWDGASPLDVTLSLAANGDYLVGFSRPHSGGTSSFLAGNVGTTTTAVRLALGSQAVDVNQATTVFERVATTDAPAFDHPEILGQPTDISALEGTAVELSVNVLGSPPLQFQWNRNDTPLEGANESILHLDPVTLADAGTYTVVVSNQLDSVTSAEAVVTVVPLTRVFADRFDNDDPLVNGNTGGDWVDATQSGVPDEGLAHGEADSLVKLPTGSGSWNIGGIKTTDVFPVGSIVTVVFNGFEPVWTEDGGADRGNGLLTQLQGQISLNDWANQEEYPSAYKNDGLPGMNVELQFADGRWGFDIQRQGGANNSSITDSAAVFDESFTLPLTVTLVVNAAGDYQVTFDQPYGDGNTAPLTGSLGAGFGGGGFIAALGCQGINGNMGYALFDSITVAPGTAVPPTLEFRTVAEGLELTWSNGVLETAEGLAGDWGPVSDATSPLVVPLTDDQRYYRLVD